jgi:dipeptidyl aminopeptidase/acylaminoacyl peptidase
MPRGKRKLGLEDLETYRHVSDAQISPDGHLVAFSFGSLTHWDTKFPPSHIWTVGVNGGEPRQFTSGARTDVHPRWSPDGRILAFLSDRANDGIFQIYLLPREGGEATQLTFQQGVIAPHREIPCFQWSPDGRSIAFLMQDAESEESRLRREAGDDAIEFEYLHRFSRVWVVNVETKAAHCVTSGAVQVWEFDWSPDGREFALIVSDAPYEWSWYKTRLARVASKGGTPITVLESKKQLASPRFSLDGKLIAYLSSIWSDRGIVAGELNVVNKRGTSHVLTKGYPISVGSMKWLAGGQSILAASYERGEAALGTFDTRTNAYHSLWRESTLLAEPFSPRFSSACENTIAVVRASPANPRDVWILKPNRGRPKWKRLTDMNSQFQDIILGEQEIVEWTGADGMKIQGILIKPTGYNGKKRLPLVVIPHGGPTSLYANGFSSARDWGQHLAARGIAVLLPNFRGSTGWGIEFAEANVGDLGGKDFQDVIAGVDEMIVRGIADPNRLGIGGWSYGGFMTAWAISMERQFKTSNGKIPLHFTAAVVGAGITNWLSFHGNSHLNTWDPIHYDASPYEREGVYQKFSPMNYVANVTTPTLILHGEIDRDVPAEQGYQFYRALKDHGVEAQLVIYPREDHAIMETKHVHDLVRRVVGWFEWHLLG